MLAMRIKKAQQGPLELPAIPAAPCDLRPSPRRGCIGTIRCRAEVSNSVDTAHPDLPSERARRWKRCRAGHRRKNGKSGFVVTCPVPFARRLHAFKVFEPRPLTTVACRL